MSDAAIGQREDRDFVTALARGLEVLTCFGSGDRLLGLTEIAQMCRLPKSTVARLTHTLVQLGYLSCVPESGKYRLGTATLALGAAILARLDVRQIARPLMQELADATGALVSLGTRDRLSIIYVESCRGGSIVTLSLDVGSRIPIATTAIGRAYLAAAPASERNEVLERLRELDDASWQKVEAGVDAALDEYARTGCCSSMGEWNSQVNSIAAPFDPGGGLPRMAINVAGLAQAYPRDKVLDEFGPMLLELVGKVESRLGRRQPRP